MVKTQCRWMQNIFVKLETLQFSPAYFFEKICRYNSGASICRTCEEFCDKYMMKIERMLNLR